jgi:hypothetical protein
MKIAQKYRQQIARNYSEVILNPNYAQEAKRTNALARILGLEIGFNPDLATLGFHQKDFHKTVKILVLLSGCEAEKMLMHSLGLMERMGF